MLRYNPNSATTAAPLINFDINNLKHTTMNFRIIALGKEFANSNRKSMLCQQISKDELGMETLGAQFHWEIVKASLTPEIEAKLAECVTNKTILDRPFKLQPVTRTNPDTGDITEKLIATIQ